MIAFALPAAARAESVTAVAGEARGMTVPIGQDNYIVVGTFRDSLGFPGTYSGRYHLDTTGYNSCRGIGMGTMYCDNPPYWAGLPYRCNLISGQITLRSLGKQIDLNIGVAFPEQPLNRITSGICEQQEDPSLHDTYLLMWNRSALWPATTEEFSRGFGPLDLARGSMTGISTPVGGAPVYLDDLALHLDIYAPNANEYLNFGRARASKAGAPDYLSIPAGTNPAMRTIVNILLLPVRLLGGLLSAIGNVFRGSRA